MNIFRRNNVDSVLKSFNKAIADLEFVEKVHNIRTDKFDAVANEARQAARAAEAEAARARTINAKFKELLSA